MDLVELARHLRQEYIFVLSEKEELQKLTEEVARLAEQLGQISWISRRQKNVLERLICASSTITPETCYKQLNALEQINFLQSYLLLSYHESKIGEFLRSLSENPKLVAFCLTKCLPELVTNLSSLIFNSLYGNAILPDDEHCILYLLKHLIHMQVIPSKNPRQLLRKGSCAFSVLFKLYTESMFSAKLFLTAALHKPIMQLLMEDEWFYDIDPVRALHRFPSAEKIRRFGSPNSPSYSLKVNEYRELMISKLFAIADRFIVSLRNSMYCFPPALAWIISELFHSVSKTGNIDALEAKAMCADLVLSSYICLAICDPELYGITSDAPLSYIARHNLMQVAQILQVLSVSQLEDIDGKVKDLYGKFEQNCMTFLLDTVLEKPAADVPPKLVASSTEFVRSSVLITQKDLVELVTILRQVESTAIEDSTEMQDLHRLVENLPSISMLQPQLALQSTVKSVLQSPVSVLSLPETPLSRKKSNKGGKEKKYSMGNVELQPENSPVTENTYSQTSIDDVLVISLGIISEPPGMISEHKVLEQESKQKKSLKTNSVLPGEDYPISESDLQVHEKRTRFSLSHDQDSIATSDNLEGISEGASSRSMASDIENENDADNLSDMVSANVSERGTPNISGRETPTSQQGSQLDGHEDRRAPELPVLVRKTNREDVTEKFGKFDLRQELEYYEAKSTVSDSWSTDVLASDSEPPEQNQLERLEEVAEEMVRQNLLAVKLQEVFEVSETASDAWSTDVLASDTSERPVDRLSELEQDDNVNSATPIASSEPSAENAEMPDQSLEDHLPSASAASARIENPVELYRSLSSDNIGLLQANSSMQLKEADGRSANRNGFDNNIGQKSARKLHISSAPVNNNVMSGVIFDNAQKSVSEVIASFSDFSPESFSRNPRVSSSLQYTDGKVASALEMFDPFHTKIQLGNRTESSHLSNMAENSSRDSGFLQHSTDLLTSGDNLASASDTQKINRSILRDSVSRNSRSRRMQGVLDDTDNETLLDNSQNWMSDDGGIDTFDDSIQVLEQQNTKIDTRRFSSVTAMDYFDVLCDDNKETKSPTEKKPPSSDSTNAQPRISLKLNSVELDLVGSAQEPSASLPWTQATSSVDNEHNSSRLNDVGIILHSDSLGSLDGGVVEENDSWHNSGRHSSNSDSRHSERVSDSSGITDNNRFRLLRKEVDSDDPDERLSPQKKKSGATAVGFLQSVKERLSRGGKRVKTPRQQERDEQHRSLSADGEKGRVSIFVDGVHGSVTFTDESRRGELPNNNLTETSDDILAKYRKPAAKTNSQEIAAGDASTNVGTIKTKDENKIDEPAYDPANLETCVAFQDAKKKLRKVLSQTDPSLFNFPSRQHGERRESELIAFLQLQLAEAINLKDRDFAAQLHEAIRCLRQFDTHEVRRIVRALKEEYKSRSVYISYLVRCRQGLLGTRAHLEKLRQRVERDKVLCTKHFLSVYARFFLERKERYVTRFVSDFQKLTVSDEKTDLVERFLNDLYLQLERDTMWQFATQLQLDEAKLYIERILMGHIYTHALYPNGDGDQMRDMILFEHLRKLGQVVTPEHKDLRIPKAYHYECPWPAAQADIALINAYKTPQDKLHCVLRCSATIMNLLSLASDRSVPAADDFMPVLLYVIIKANPPGLLSTVQYVTSFYGKRMQGEEQYWWLQFTSAIEFLKTMDYES